MAGDGATSAAGAATHKPAGQDNNTRAGRAGAGYACDASETPEKYAMTKKEHQGCPQAGWGVPLGNQTQVSAEGYQCGH